MNTNELPNVFTDHSDDLVFDAPWQAQAFAMTVKLHEGGMFTWKEWAATLSSEIKLSGNPDAGMIVKNDSQDEYYRCWLGALEKLIVKKQLGTTDDLATLKKQWANAAERVPHGQLIKIGTAKSA